MSDTVEGNLGDIMRWFGLEVAGDAWDWVLEHEYPATNDANGRTWIFTVPKEHLRIYGNNPDPQRL